MQTIKNKSNEMLVADLKQMVAEERRLLIEVLHHLQEVEDRRLYLERGYSTLFAFATEELGYSEAAANRRIQAVRLMRELPEVEEKVKTGKLSLSVASQVQSFFRQEEKKRKGPISTSEKRDLVLQLEGTSARSCEKKIAQIAPEIKKPREKARPLTEATTLIQFVADKEMMEGIEKLKPLLAHGNPEGRLALLFKKLVSLGLEKWDPVQRAARRRKKVSKPNKNSTPTSESKSRYVPAAVRDEVWERDKGQCRYQDPVTGRACGSRHGLQLD
ncbi:MAG: hypothetical protein HY609_05010, partial [Deltaproteobacteria bacterium]|nr:hypothetical protein [Deltaproteobacteria bacterium]